MIKIAGTPLNAWLQREMNGTAAGECALNLTVRRFMSYIKWYDFYLTYTNIPIPV